MKKFILAISLLVFSACTSYNNIKDCQFSFQSVSKLMVNDISFDGKTSLKDFTPADVAVISKGLMSEMPITFTANVKIDNPNNQKAELSALEWILLVKDVEVANGVLDKKVKIAARESVVVPLDVETNTRILKKFSLTEIKNMIFAISKSNSLPANSVLKVKPAIVVAGKMIKTPTYFTIDLN